MSRVLEVCCFCVEDAIVAQDAGADRIELCAGRPEDGTTPSLGMLEQARSKLSIPVFPMVRPRGGDFVYGEQEFAAMQRDVSVIAEIGFPGVVFGLLKSDNSVDLDRTADLIGCAGTMEVTFHRAFDSAADPIVSALAIAEIGCTRILTSGQQPTALEGSPLLRDLIGLSGAPLIMPGSGVRPSNIEMLLGLGATEFHSTCTVSSTEPTSATLVSELAQLIH